MTTARSNHRDNGRKIKKSRLALFTMLAAGLSLTTTLVLTEIFLRLFLPQPASWVPGYRRIDELPFYVNRANVEHHVYTGETDWTILTDSRGFRYDPEASTDGSCRVLWLGDSFIFGNGVDYQQSLVGYMNQHSPDVDHINAGVAGHGPPQYRQIFDYLLDQELDFDRVYVATFLGNDFHDTIWDKNVVVVDGFIGNGGGLDSFLKQKFHFRRLISNLYHSIAPPDQFAFVKIVDDLANPVKWEEEFLSEAFLRYGNEMREIRDTARARGLDLAVLVLPTRDAVGYLRAGRKNGPPGRDPMLPVEKATDLLDRLEIPYLDATTVLATESLEDVFFRFDGHLTALGNELAGEAFLERFGRSCPTTSSNHDSRTIEAVE